MCVYVCIYKSGASEDFITEVSCNIETAIYAAHEAIFSINDPSEHLYIVHIGTVFCQGRLKHPRYLDIYFFSL